MTIPTIIQGARHRGRILTTSESPQYARSVLASLGFGPNISVWDTVIVPGNPPTPYTLPPDWPADAAKRVDQPPYLTYFFEADWTGPIRQVPLSNPTPPTPQQIADGQLDWRFFDIGAYCWTDPTWGQTPPYGLAWCPGVAPPVWQGPPPLDPNQPPAPPDVPAATPRRKGTSPWLAALGAAAVVIPVGILIVTRSHPSSPRISDKGAKGDLASPRRRRSA